MRGWVLQYFRKNLQGGGDGDPRCLMALYHSFCFGWERGSRQNRLIDLSYFAKNLQGWQWLIFGFDENQPLPTLNILQRPVIANVVKQSQFINLTSMILVISNKPLFSKSIPSRD